MTNRREFIRLSALGSAALLAGSACTRQDEHKKGNISATKTTRKPLVISTWNHGMTANKVSWEVLSNSGTSLDAVEAGVRVVESDPEGTSVGVGGAPDRDGIVTLDACIMDHKNRCGAVAFLPDIENPISVARKVMENTPHVMLAGEGAYRFAREQGFPKTNLLTEKSKKAWQDWLKTSDYKLLINRENHDTIGSLALDEHGNLAGACTTSGMAYKLHGRVGDSPIIGAGLFVDNDVGAACATGVGEAVIRTAGSAIVVESMRYGLTPREACEEAVRRIIDKHDNIKDLQVGFLALNRYGEYGAYSIHKGFSYAVHNREKSGLIDSRFELKHS